MRQLDHIIIHCSATRETTPFTEQQLEASHRARGFRTCGYHYYIRRSGQIIPMRPLSQMGAHAQGHNASSIGICYEGGLDASGKPKDTRTPQQKQSLIHLVHTLCAEYHITRIDGHRDLSPDLDGDGKIEPREYIKMCPCFNVHDEF